MTSEQVYTHFTAIIILGTSSNKDGVAEDDGKKQ